MWPAITRPLLWGWLGASLLCCQSTPFDYVGGDDAAITQVTQAQANNVVDIVFVIDNSGSMADKQATLRRSSAAFVAELAASNVDYRLGILTTDLYASSDGGRLRQAPGGPRFLRAPAPGDPNAAALRSAIVANFNATVTQLGTGGSGLESALGAVTHALAPSDATVAQYNAGFLRPEADLAVIIVTDEDDCAPLPQNEATVNNSNNVPTFCYTNQNLLYAPEALVDQFAAIKGDVGRVRVALITAGSRDAAGSFVPKGCNVGSNGRPDTRCGCWSYDDSPWFCTDLKAAFGQPCSSVGSCPQQPVPGSCPASGAACDTPRCTSTSPHRYLQFLGALTAQRQALGQTAGTYVDSICQSDYQTTLIEVARAVVINDCFTLASSANRAGLGLRVAHALDDGRLSQETVLERYGDADPLASCTDCASCAGRAWQLVDGGTGAAQMCLACGTVAAPGDVYKVSNLSPTTP